MDQNEAAFTDKKSIARAWNDMLPTILNEGDRAKVEAGYDGGPSLCIHIDAAGHSMYSFDFNCSYVDPREVDVQLIRVMEEGHSSEPDTPVVRAMIDDYTRHIHEAAQALHPLTNSTDL